MNPDKTYLNVRYRIEFFSEWHCGSGLSAGADTDALVIKDAQGLPYIPGKTVKGLLREAAEEIAAWNPALPGALLPEALGIWDEAETDPAKAMSQGEAFFSNAELPADERKTIVDNGLQVHLYRRVASTAIGEEGVAVDGSLRSMETTVPCTLEGEIRHLNSALWPLMAQSAQYIKRLGVNRNRGLGRCSVTMTCVEA